MTEATDIASLMRDMRDLADRIVECQGENSDGEEIIHLYDQSDTTFKAQNILLVLNAFEAERHRADKYRDCIRVLADKLSVNALPNEIIDAVAELAALKGEQVPVITCYSCRKVMTRDQHAEADGFCPHCDVEIELDEDGELFTAPQKPVVLPGRVTGQGMRETFNYLMSQEEADSAANGFNQCLIESKSAIEAADCSVQTSGTDNGGDHQSSAPAVLHDVLTAVSIGGSRTELIDALMAIKPKFGAPGSRDVDVRAAHVAIDKAIEKLSNL